VLLTHDGVEIRHGGFGSALARVPGKEDEVYLLTDRGPNFDGPKDTKCFPLPDYCPSIGRFRIEADGLTLLAEIQLQRPAGTLLTGRPNPDGKGATGEKAVDLQGKSLDLDPFGIDCEGLAAARDGSFWISDEYGPHLVHVSASGRELERINPFGSGTGGRRLPRVLAKRHANRGMEGLTLRNDGGALVGILQSALDVPDSKAGKASAIVRIVVFELASGKTSQYAYVRENPDTNCSEICAIPGKDTQFLVVERDGRLPGAADNPAKQKAIYRIDLAGADDVGDPADGEMGRLFDGLTLEQLQDGAGLERAKVKPVAKEPTPIVDCLKLGFPSEKLEGLAVFDAHTILVCNDDDFAITAKDGALVQKRLASGAIEGTVVYAYAVDRALE
jgi:hypothetical protein